jgi:hypothetical protein
MSDEDGSDRLARIEVALEAVGAAVGTHGEALGAVGAAVGTHGEALGAVGAAVRTQGEMTALGFETLTDTMRVLDARMVVLDARMTELATRFPDHLRGHGSAA